MSMSGISDVEHDHAVYVEPNVWVEHDLSAAGVPG
jgi:hypothetical protein